MEASASQHLGHKHRQFRGVQIQLLKAWTLLVRKSVHFEFYFNLSDYVKRKIFHIFLKLILTLANLLFNLLLFFYKEKRYHTPGI